MIRVKMASTDQEVAVPTEIFLAEVEKRPCLWDPTHRLYREENARKLAFRLIVSKLVENAPEEKKDEMGKSLNKKWNGIRDHYFNMRKDPSKMEKYNSNPYFQLLEFLDPTLPPSYPERGNMKSAPTKAIAADRKFVAIKDQKVHATNQGASSKVSSSDNQTVWISTSQLSSPANQVSNTQVSHNKDRICDPNRAPTTTNMPKTKHTSQPPTTVMIDGVEFEQVTLENGEVIVKLKEEVLEDIPPPKETVAENSGNQQADQTKQLGSPIELNGTRAQLSAYQVASNSQESRQGLELKRAQHSVQRVSSPPINELKITSTTTLASTAWLPLQKNELKITSTSTLTSNRFHEITSQRNVNLSQNILKLKTASGATSKIVAGNDQEILVNQGLVDNVVKSVVTSSNQVFQKEEKLTSSNQGSLKLNNTLISPDKMENFQSKIEMESMLRLCPTGSQRSTLNLTPIKRVKTNRNTQVLKKISHNSLDAEELNSSPNLSPQRKLRTNRNTVIPKDRGLSSSDSYNIEKEDSQLTPEKMLKTNQNPLTRINDLGVSDLCSDNVRETQVKRVRTNLNAALTPNKRIRNEIIDEESEQLKSQPSKRIELSCADNVEPPSTFSGNHEMVGSPDVDEDRNFLLSLLPEMKSMTETQNFDFRLAVMEALSRANFSNS